MADKIRAAMERTIDRTTEKRFQNVESKYHGAYVEDGSALGVTANKTLTNEAWV